MSDSTETPTQRKEQARKAMEDNLCLSLLDGGTVGRELIDAYARVCIDDAVAPTLEFVDGLLCRYAGTRAVVQSVSWEEMCELRKLLTEREGR